MIKLRILQLFDNILTLKPMQYTNEITINLPVDRVVALFDNPDNMKKWMPGLLSFKHLSGTPGYEGAKTRLQFQMGKREIEMVETILSRNLPEKFVSTYETKGVYNKQITSFFPVDENTTRYVSESEFQFSGLMMKVIAFLSPGSFKKQSYRYMELFKEFAEGEG